MQAGIDRQLAQAAGIGRPAGRLAQATGGAQPAGLRQLQDAGVDAGVHAEVVGADGDAF